MSGFRRITFDLVTISATRRWKENGKVRQKTRKFQQTINPFNVDTNGRPKNRDQILIELRAERDAWLKTVHP